MPRIFGVDIPGEKPVLISLQYIYGVGPAIAVEIIAKTGMDGHKRAKEMTDDELTRVTALLDKEYVVEGQLRRQVAQNIARLKKIQCYRGSRHIKSLPVRGQRTRTNARTRKGKKKTVAVKRSVKAMR